jgi:hypothetical protein
MSALDPPQTSIARQALRFFSATFLGAAFAMAIAQGSALAARFGNAEIILTAAGFLEGWAMGAMQWTALRAHLPRSAHRSWLLASSAGVGFAWAMGFVFFHMVDQAEIQPMSMALRVLTLVALLGAVVGALQWVVLGKVFERGTPWVAANALAASISMIVMFAAPARALGDPTNPATSVLVFLMQFVGLLAGALLLAAAFASMLAGDTKPISARSFEHRSRTRSDGSRGPFSSPGRSPE